MSVTLERIAEHGDSLEATTHGGLRASLPRSAGFQTSTLVNATPAPRYSRYLWDRSRHVKIEVSEREWILVQKATSWERTTSTDNASDNDNASEGCLDFEVDYEVVVSGWVDKKDLQVEDWTPEHWDAQ